jgi:hypothetical protein
MPPNLVGFDPIANALQSLATPALPTPLQHSAQASPFPIIEQPVPIDYKLDSVEPQNPSRVRSPGRGHVIGTEEEAVVYNFPRLLKDPTGRLRKSTFLSSYRPESSPIYI